MKTMLKCSLLAVAALASLSCAPPANTNVATNANTNANVAAKPAAPTADSLMALENKAWEAYKNRDGKYFEAFLGDRMINGEGRGTMAKADVVKGISENKDEIRSFTLSEPHVTPVGSDAAVLTYKAVTDGTANGKTIPSPATAATVFVRSGTDWKAVYHEEAAIMDPAKVGGGAANKAASSPAPAAGDVKKESATPSANTNSPVANNSSASNTNSTAPAADDAALTDALMAVERKGWEGWKAKDSKALDEVTTGGKDFVHVNASGKATMGKDNVMKMWTTDNTCTVSSVNVSDGKSMSLGKDAAILVYKGTAVGTCGDMKLEPLWGTTVFVKEGNLWKAAYVFEMPIRTM